MQRGGGGVFRASSRRRLERIPPRERIRRRLLGRDARRRHPRRARPVVALCGRAQLAVLPGPAPGAGLRGRPRGGGVDAAGICGKVVKGSARRAENEQRAVAVQQVETDIFRTAFTAHGRLWSDGASGAEGGAVVDSCKRRTICSRGGQRSFGSLVAYVRALCPPPLRSLTLDLFLHYPLAPIPPENG